MQHDTTKREFVKKSAYMVPAVLTLAATPSFASGGSNSGRGKKPKHDDKDYYKPKKGGGEKGSSGKKERDG
jgi:hypothetical protein